MLRIYDNIIAWLESDCKECERAADIILLRDYFDKEMLANAVAYHRETWYAVGRIKNDERYAEYIDSVIHDEAFQEELLKEYGL